MKKDNFINLAQNITVMNMSGIYKKQPDFINKLNECGASFINAENMKGTDCYCDDEARRELNEMMKKHSAFGVHFIDGGNYHYLSKLWLDFIDEPFKLVVFDNHPDMQPPAFGDVLSCGGWVRALISGGAGELVKKVPSDINILAVGVKDEYVSLQMRDMGVEFLTGEEFEKIGLDAAKKRIRNFVCGCRPVYISVDKDVLCREECMTNWDQGKMKTDELFEMLEEIFDSSCVTGLDVCGELDAMGDRQYGGIYNEKNQKINMRILEFINKKNCVKC